MPFSTTLAYRPSKYVENMEMFNMLITTDDTPCVSNAVSVSSGIIVPVPSIERCDVSVKKHIFLSEGSTPPRYIWHIPDEICIQIQLFVCILIACCSTDKVDPFSVSVDFGSHG